MTQPGDTITLKMRPVQHNFLHSRKSNCSEKWSYYECLGAQYATSTDYHLEACNDCDKVKKCSPFTFPNMGNYNISLCPLEPINNTNIICADCIWEQMLNTTLLQKNKVCLSIKQSGYAICILYE